MAHAQPKGIDYTRIAADLQQIHDLVTNGNADDAISRIDTLVSELKSTHSAADESESPEPWRIIAAHLKAAQVQIEQTHLSPAADSISKAIYAATHESQVSLEAPDPQLNV